MDGSGSQGTWATRAEELTKREKENRQLNCRAKGYQLNAGRKNHDQTSPCPPFGSHLVNRAIPGSIPVCPGFHSKTEQREADQGNRAGEAYSPSRAQAYPSGQEIVIEHTWDEEGTYTISAKARDDFNAESEWAYLEVTMPVNQQTGDSLFTYFIERFPNAIPLIRGHLRF